MPQFSAPIAASRFHGVPIKTTEPGSVGTSRRPSVLGPTQPTPHVVVTLPRLSRAVTVLQTCLAQGLSDLGWVTGFCARDPRGDCPAHHVAGTRVTHTACHWDIDPRPFSKRMEN